MICANCGQVTAKGTAWGLSFIPCACPRDKETEKKRYDFLKQRIDEAYARLHSE